MQKRITYKNSGVNIDAGEAFVKAIRPYAESTRNIYSMDNIGAFAGMIDLSSGSWNQPVMVACTDGVGTKLKIAFEMDRHDSIGVDLVAMSVNDLLVTGATPVAFLDYLATSKIDSEKHAAVVAGISEGCLKSGCALLGGETAEMPGFYKPGEYDIAGFAIGIVEKKSVLDPKSVVPGDVLIGLPSSGLHSNGYSLVRKVFENRTVYPLNSVLPGFNRSLGEELLIPTHIYSSEFSILGNLHGVKAAAHITGGGIPGNLPRALPDELGVSIVQKSWPIPKIFTEIQNIGRIESDEMFRTFNMGLGMILVVDGDSSNAIQKTLEFHGYSSFMIGSVTSGRGFKWSLSSSKKTSGVAQIQIRKANLDKSRIAIMGSGRGSNMQSICDAIDRGDINAEIVCVISNNSRAYIMERADNRGIPAFHVSRVTHPDNETDALVDILVNQQADTLVLAGYMKKVPEKVLTRFAGRVFNIHPALLPAFGGQGMYGLHVHRAVINSGARYSGVTVHRVDADYDKGQILNQRVVPVLASDTPESLAARILPEEHDLYWRTLKQYL
jgi:phosphoribosylamine--glycine ligase / phosphoribosylglycinamide formyltransferase / phosphoribosylformylglycinamidine cyclo-ligase